MFRLGGCTEIWKATAWQRTESRYSTKPLLCISRAMNVPAADRITEEKMRGRLKSQQFRNKIKGKKKPKNILIKVLRISNK
jgi:hypothetical protein